MISVITVLYLVTYLWSIGNVVVTGLGRAGVGLDAVAAQPGTVISCQSPPLRLRLLPKAWPGAVSPT
jgi:hypothetical protein